MKYKEGSRDSLAVEERREQSPYITVRACKLFNSIAYPFALYVACRFHSSFLGHIVQDKRGFSSKCHYPLWSSCFWLGSTNYWSSIGLAEKDFVVQRTQLYPPKASLCSWIPSFLLKRFENDFRRVTILRVRNKKQLRPSLCFWEKEKFFHFTPWTI